MKNFYEFAANNPFLTAFLFVVIFSSFTEIIKAVCK